MNTGRMAAHAPFWNTAEKIVRELVAHQGVVLVGGSEVQKPWLAEVEDSVGIFGPNGEWLFAIAKGGVAPVLYGDLTGDGRVDMYDIAELSCGWQSIYLIDDLVNVVEDWLK